MREPSVAQDDSLFIMQRPLIANLFQCCPQRVDRQMAGVDGLIGQATYGLDQSFSAEGRSLSRSEADEHFRQRRTAGDRRDASLRPVASLGDVPGSKPEAELHNVAARRIVHLYA